MNFRRIEYILIVSFLLLNIFLAFVFVSKNSILFLNPTNQAAINVGQEMQSDDITYPELETENRALPLVRAQRQRLLSDQMDELDEDVQELSMGNSERLFSRFDEAIELPGLTADVTMATIDESVLAPINKLLTNGTIIEGDEYQFYTYEPRQRIIRYVQKTDLNIPIVDTSSEIVFLLNDDFNIISYEQTLSGQTIAQGDKRTLISEKSALENLYLNNRLPHNSSVIKSHLGYYTTLPLIDMIVYSPVWTFTIQTEDGGITTLYIDAITGAMIQNGGMTTTTESSVVST